jgi:hypothetical protein
MIKATAAIGGFEPAELVAYWRGASAAAHGKRWFQQYGYSSLVGDEFEPGMFRAVLVPRPEQISETVAAGLRMLQAGVIRYATGMGYNHRKLYERALVRVEEKLPRRTPSQQ